MSSSHAETKFHHSDADDTLSDDNAEFDQPRVAQWVDEEDLDEDVESGDESSSDTHSNSNIDANEKYNRLEEDLSKLPLGAIVKARKTMKRTETSSSSEEEEFESDVDSEPEESDGEHAKKKSREAHHRSSKHAPMELTSKKPITRRRQVVEVHHNKSRDPRFSDLSGSLDINRYHSQYGFLNDMHKEEFSTLKSSLARARKLLANSPSNLRESREIEVGRLERALKKAESVVNRERQQQVESQALNKLRKEEKEKQKTGKKAWWLKKSDEKAIRQRARTDALAESGGQRAVKKAEEKKQRKIGQKEKKSRPFPRPQQSGNNSSGSNKRRGDSSNGQQSRNAKRPRLDR